MLSVEKDKIVSDFLQGFSNKNMILYIGTSVSNNELNIISKYPWAGIVTSRRDEELKTFFVNENRRIHECETFEEIPPRVFSKETLNLIRLYGVNRQNLEDEDSEIYEARLKSNANKIWSYIVSKMDVSTNMCVIGYDAGKTQEYPRLELIISLDQIRGGIISFFGINDNSESIKKLKKNVIDRGHVWCTDNLGELLKDDVDINSNENIEDSNNFFWIGGKSVSLSDNIIMPLCGSATLLTENLIYKIRPFGKIQQSRWYQEFLSRSAESGPQWYGYLKNSEFYLKRDYEIPLTAWVRNVLHGQEASIAEYKEPIVLEGHPGSSKSICLSALALHVFEEKQYPVIYITQKELNNNDYDALDRLMLTFRDISEDNCKTLIVWDGSTYSNTTKTAREMAAYLANRGRRFVLVCSAYKTNYDSTEEVQWYKYMGDNRFNRNRLEGEIKYINGCFYIHATRILSKNELIDLKNKVKQYCPSSAKDILVRWDKLREEENNNIFYYLYSLMVLLQQPLEKKLRLEQGIVSNYVQKRLDLLQEKESELEDSDFLSPMQNALKDAGIDFSDYEITEGITNYDLERFNTCVALFSRFKIDVPVALPLSVLIHNNKECINIYGEKYRALFNELTTNIPWIIYKENVDGEFCFVYRSQLEADIFLRKASVIDISEQVNMICEMLEYYYEDYKRYGILDHFLRNVLQRLLRMIGPNSEYIEFKTPENSEHKEFVSRLDKLIAKIQWLRKECGMPDEDASFAIIEVTFIREYYSTKIRQIMQEKTQDEDSNTVLIKYIKSISDACILANKKIYDLQIVDSVIVPKNMRSNSINSLSVEIARCCYIIKNTVLEYSELKNSLNSDLIKLNTTQIFVMSYKEMYNLLKRAIYSDPQNGYSYNALFQAFEQEYKEELKRKNKKKCFQLLSEIMLIVDEACLLGDEIYNRGANKDELGEHLLEIRSYSDNTIVTIEQIINNSCESEFASLFEEMLAEGNAAGICYVSRRELDTVRKYTNDNGEIDEMAIPVYKKVKDFLRTERFFDAVKNNSQALYLLLKVTWATYVNRELNKGECHLTDLTDSQWREILEICELYENADKIPRPIVILMHALAIVQINWDYEEAGRILGGLREDMFFGKRRMSVPYVVSESGSAKLYNGKVISDENVRSMRVRLDGIHRWTENSARGVLYPKRNFGGNISSFHKGDIITDLELGIGYMGFSLYTEEERKKKEARI